MGEKPQMVGRVTRTSACPRCGSPLILIDRDIVTSGGLIAELWLCPRDGAGCDTALALFSSGIDANGAPATDDYADEIAALVKKWYRSQRNLEALRGSQDARPAIAESTDPEDTAP